MRLFSVTATAAVSLLFSTGAEATPDLYTPWPCGVSYRVTQGHNVGSHVGVYNAWAWDFGIPVGGELTAPAPGVVSHVRMNSTVGGCDAAYAADANYLVIDFGDGTSASFTHLQANSTTLRVGDRVEQGDVVGRVGLSGYVCGAHLHFSIVETCGNASCPTIPASFVDFGDPASGTTLISNNCGGGHPVTALEAGVFSGTDSDIDGDGRADVCARSSQGIRCRLSDGSTLAAAITGPALTDAAGWDVANAYSTLRLADVTGDGKADLCARAPDGFGCWPSTADGFGDRFAIDDLDDDSGWNRLHYYSTIRMGDVNGDGRADVCARGGSGVRCWPSLGDGFGPAIAGPPMSDANGWQFPEFYGTIRVADVDGDGMADICGRSSDYYHCWMSDGAGFPTLVDGPAWTDAGGWTMGRHYRTIRLADIDADGDLDVCGRTATDFRCHRWTDGDFEDTAVVGPSLSDELGWNDASNFSTIRMADVDGDGRADICARANAGMLCWLATPDGFSSTAIGGPELSDATGFDDPAHYLTIRLADVNGDGRADICGRQVDGFRCWLADDAGFSPVVPGPSWSDELGWAEPEYYSTLQIGGPKTPRCATQPEICDGLDNNCNGAVDEDDVCVVEPDAGADAGAGSSDGGDAGIPVPGSPDAGGSDAGTTRPPRSQHAKGGCQTVDLGANGRGNVLWVLLGAIVLRRRRRTT